MSLGLRATLVGLRVTGLLALLLLLLNPPWLRIAPAAQPPLVLLDASLSLAGTGGRWREALDSAQAVAGPAGVVWRFGERVTGFDTLPPDAGASRLAPALDAAAARRGPVTVVTDGELATDGIAPDLGARPRILILPRTPFRDAYVAEVTGTRRVAPDDTLWLTVTIGAAGPRPRGAPGGAVRVVALLDDRRLAERAVALPDSGSVAVDLAVPARRLPAGSAALTVALEGVADAEPRDDARRFVVETTTRPGVVVLADPPDWELRFLARELGDVVRAPLRTFVRTAPGTPWRDGTTLAAVSDLQVTAAVGEARLIVRRPGTTAPGMRPNAAQWLVTESGREGDWYVTRPPASRVGAALAGVAWDSLPPLTAAVDGDADSGATTVVAAALLRRGRPVPVVTLAEQGAVRRVTLRAAGFWRWAFRGGASAVAYRGLVAGLADWLLGAPGARRERAVPVDPDVPNGLPLVWRWAGADSARDLALRLEGGDGAARTETLRFDAAGHAEVRVPAGTWRYVLADGPERGVVVVEAWSAEWQPGPVMVAAQPGLDAGAPEAVGLRERGWLFVLAIAAFATEWALRRRQGFP